MKPDDTPDDLDHSPEASGQSDEDTLQSLAWEVDVPEALASEPAPEPAVATETPPPTTRIVEALLFAGGPPLTLSQARDIIRGLTPEQFQQSLEELNLDYRRQGRPYAIQPQGPGLILTLRPRYRRVLDKLYGTTREARLSAAAIDVLALVAYRQPATKQEIDSLRGAESGSLLKQLVRRGLIAVVQRADAAQREVAYGTTPRFLELFGLSSLDDLPRTQDLQQI